MLVLSRKPNQEILIGDNIKLTILRVKGNTVRIGIEAPQEIRVVRGELSAEPTTGTELTVRFSPQNEVESKVESARVLPFDLRESTVQSKVNHETDAGCEPSAILFPSATASSDCLKLPANRIQEVLARLARNADVSSS